jgi:hypothetical protein
LTNVRPIKTAEFTTDAVYALAAAWASIDGKLERFAKDTPGSRDGTRDGYMIEAEEMVKRLYTRGFKVVPITG